MPKIERTSKNLLALFFFAISAKNDAQEDFVRHSLTNFAKNSKNNKFNKILDLQREKAKKGIENAANFANNSKKQ